jgi:L-fuculose-phosphate aldolase
MLLDRERRLVVQYAKRLRPDGLVVLTAGNISVRSGDLVAITPGSYDYDLLTPERICVVHLDGTVAEARLTPSSELPMHLAVYRAAPEARAVVHTHAPYASALSTVVDELPALHYLIAQLGGPVRVAPYATFGSEELAENVARALEGRNAALLGNHGTIAFGETLEEAYSRTMLLEWLSALYLRSSLLGEPRLLAAEEIDLVARKLILGGAPAGSPQPSDGAPRAREPGRGRRRVRAAGRRLRESRR